MWEKSAAFIVSFIAMVFVASSYFFQKKSLYLFCQAVGIVGITPLTFSPIIKFYLIRRTTNDNG